MTIRWRVCTGLMFEFTVLAFAVLLGFLLGATWQLHVKRHKEPKHRHAFGEWEETTVNYWGNGKIDYKVSAQKRKCLSCGYKEVRDVC